MRGPADPAVLDRVKTWRPYVEAKLGFRNHWYPALFSEEMEEGRFQSVMLLGEKILLSRQAGRVYAVRDRCLHRGVAFSARPECFAEGTVTCWYHGWTYRLADGRLCGVATEPGCSLVEKIKLETYPVREVQGVLFVFVGDIDPPDLGLDVPPGFLDEDLFPLGISRLVNANWRMGCENGFDSTHIIIHKDSIVIAAMDAVVPLGFALTPNSKMQTVTSDGAPKGVVDDFRENYTPIFEARIRGEHAFTPVGATGHKVTIFRVSIWLPCALMVENHPEPDVTQYEWYVPVDEDRHLYFQFLGKRGAITADDRERYRRIFHDLYVPLTLHGFNDDDVWAREAMEKFYGDDTGWIEERLFEPDLSVVEWRKLASRHNRGIQPPARSS